MLSQGAAPSLVPAREGRVVRRAASWCKVQKPFQSERRYVPFCHPLAATFQQFRFSNIIIFSPRAANIQPLRKQYFCLTWQNYTSLNCNLHRYPSVLQELLFTEMLPEASLLMPYKLHPPTKSTLNSSLASFNIQANLLPPWVL